MYNRLKISSDNGVNIEIIEDRFCFSGRESFFGIAVLFAERERLIRLMIVDEKCSWMAINCISV